MVPGVCARGCGHCEYNSLGKMCLRRSRYLAAMLGNDMQQYGETSGRRWGGSHSHGTDPQKPFIEYYHLLLDIDAEQWAFIVLESISNNYYFFLLPLFSNLQNPLQCAIKLFNLCVSIGSLSLSLSEIFSRWVSITFSLHCCADKRTKTDNGRSAEKSEWWMPSWRNAVLVRCTR